MIFAEKTSGGLYIIACVIPTLLSLAGCKQPIPPPAVRADYTETLNKYYEGRPMCLWETPIRFPLENPPLQIVDELGLDGLTDSGLLSEKGKRGAKATYDLTPQGRSALNPDVFQPGAGNFCYGRRKIISIDTARRNSSTTELVDFHYRITEPAAWAAEPAIRNAFPQLAAELAGAHAAEVTLLDTTAGWEVSGTPSILVPRPPRTHSSPLARVFHLKKKSG